MPSISIHRLTSIYRKADQLIGFSQKLKRRSVRHYILVIRVLLLCLLFLYPHTSMAASASELTLGSIATMVTQSFTDVTKLITGASYVTGLGFSFSAVMKFKQHITNPTQNTIGAAFAILFIGAIFLYFPSFLEAIGQTMYGGYQVTAGPWGLVFSSNVWH